MWGLSQTVSPWGMLLVLTPFALLGGCASQERCAAKGKAYAEGKLTIPQYKCPIPGGFMVVNPLYYPDGCDQKIITARRCVPLEDVMSAAWREERRKAKEQARLRNTTLACRLREDCPK